MKLKLDMGDRNKCINIDCKISVTNPAISASAKYNNKDEIEVLFTCNNCSIQVTHYFKYSNSEIKGELNAKC